MNTIYWKQINMRYEEKDTRLPPPQHPTLSEGHRQSAYLYLMLSKWPGQVPVLTPMTQHTLCQVCTVNLMCKILKKSTSKEKNFRIKTYSHKEPNKITKQSPSWVTFPTDIDNQEFPHCMILNKIYQHICWHYPICWILLSGIFFLTFDTCCWLKPLSKHSDYSFWLSEVYFAFFYKILLIQRIYFPVH